MTNTVEIIRALVLLCWPICILAIAFIFRAEIKILIRGEKRNRDCEESPKAKRNLEKIEAVSENDAIKITDPTASIGLNLKKEFSTPSAFHTKENIHHSNQIRIDTSSAIESINPPDTVANHLIIRSYISVCKNKQSGKYFIILDEHDGNAIKLVTPKCEIKVLKLALFTEPEELDEYEMLEARKLTKGQVDLYYKELDKKEDVLLSISKGFYNKQSNGIEPQYIHSYRKMLSSPDTMPSIMLYTVKRYRRIKWTDLIEKLASIDGYKGTGGSLGASLRVLYIDGHVMVEGKGDGKIISAS